MARAPICILMKYEAAEFCLQADKFLFTESWSKDEKSSVQQ